MTVNTIVNGDFQTNNFTGWATAGTVGSGKPLIYQNGPPPNETYNCNLGIDYPYQSGHYCSITQDITLDSNMTSIAFDKIWTFNSGCTLVVSLRESGSTWTDIYTQYNDFFDFAWYTITVTKSTITGLGITLANVDQIRFKVFY
jgi:hypothetical protein